MHIFLFPIRQIGSPGSGRWGSNLKVSENSLENSVYKVTLDQNGDISSIVDKRYNRELVKPGGLFRLALTEGNMSQSWPAWEILKATIDKEGVSVSGDVNISVAESGPARASLKLKGCSWIRVLSSM